MNTTRRKFLKSATLLTGASLVSAPERLLASAMKSKAIAVNAHLWVYASAYPPTWDCWPVMENVFLDLSYAGVSGVELMEIHLRREDAVPKLHELMGRYHLPVSGTSYGASLWKKEQRNQNIEDAEHIIGLVKSVGGKTFGISTGDAHRLKTEEELDVQAEVLKKIIETCNRNGIVHNVHNHTYEIDNDLHELKGNLSRVPELKLGPDLNWLIRGGIDPVHFINTYSEKIVYLHLRDQRSDGVWTETVGEGSTDFQAIAGALEKNGFSGMAAIELAFPKDFQPSRPLKEDWKISRNFVRKTFGW